MNISFDLPREKDALSYNEAQLLNTFRKLPPNYQSNLLEHAEALKVAFEITRKDRIKSIICNTAK